MFKRLLSYFIPINVYRRNSALSKSLEITWANGELVLDSQNTNYSYGSLQRILRKGLTYIGFDIVRDMESILVLGVAGGSVIKTLTEEIGTKAHIVGVEIDSEIIDIANQYFGLHKIPNLSIVIDDAFEFVLKTKNKYDLIIIDIFQDTKMPGFLFETFFANRVCEILNQNGQILFNTMILNDLDEKRNNDYLISFDDKLFDIKKIPRVEKHNEVIVIARR